MDFPDELYFAGFATVASSGCAGTNPRQAFLALRNKVPAGLLWQRRGID